MLKHKWRVHSILVEAADRYDIRIYRFANIGNHVHLLIQAKSRANFQGFLREFTGRIAMMITGAVKGRPEKFWDHLAHSKLVQWGRQFQNTVKYILLNVLEGMGRKRDRELLARLEKNGVALIRPEPGS